MHCKVQGFNNEVVFVMVGNSVLDFFRRRIIVLYQVFRFVMTFYAEGAVRLYCCGCTMTTQKTRKQ